jgi:adenosylmethionine-8-amino-7-oxononanoate aminotransferase
MTSTDLGVDRAQRLRSLTRRVMVDFNQMKTFTRDPLIVVDGKGVRLTDVDGKSYIDGLSGVFTVSLGHGNEAIIDAVMEQHRRVSFSSPIMSTTDRALELAAELVRISRDRVEVVKQLGSGSEATEAAIKMARQYHRQTGSPERYKTISFYRSYHGATMGALSATGWPQLRNPYEPLVHGGLHVMPPTPGRCRFCAPGGECSLGCLANLRDTIELEGPSTVSAVIVEPVMLTAGVYVQSPAFFRELRRVCDEFGVVLIFDEIVSGFGRLGEWFAADLFDVWPDIACIGKGLTSGYAPLSAVLLSERTASAFWGDGGRQFQAGHTYAGNPVSAAAGLAVIAYMEEHRVFENVLARGAELSGRLDALAAKHPVVAAVRGLGLLYCMDFDGPAAVGADGRLQPIGTAVQRAARARGLLLRASPHNATLAPPLVTTAAEIDEIATIVEESVAEVAGQLESSGAVDVEIGFGL